MQPGAMDIQQFNPSMLTYPEPTDFDYGAFLQSADDVAFHQQHQQSLAPNPHTGHASPGQQAPPLAPTAFSDSSVGRVTPPSDGPSARRDSSTDLVRKGSELTGKQRLERRGHTKSRRGCYNCKRRRIKVRTLPLSLPQVLSAGMWADLCGRKSARRRIPPVGIVSRRA